MHIETLRQLNQYRENGNPVALLTDISNERHSLISAIENELTGPGHLLAREVLSSDQCLYREEDSAAIFAQPFNPPLRMIIVGAVHIAEDLIPIANSCGFEVLLVDPRQAFANDRRFPDVNISNDWPDVALQDISPDERTAIITLSHDPKIDDPALELALASNAFYIGCLGSRRTHAARLERLSDKQFSEEQQGRIKGPIGLDIGARSTTEIAVSIMAEVITAYRKKN